MVDALSRLQEFRSWKGELMAKGISPSLSMMNKKMESLFDKRDPHSMLGFRSNASDKEVSILNFKQK